MTSPYGRSVHLTWDQLRYTVKAKGDDCKVVDKELLHGISGTARGGRTLAVMGPSGAGKSTFLNGISGRLQVGKHHILDGTAYLNNVIFLSRYKALVSYVAQDDIVMGKDTPREAITFSYRMRTGASADDAKTEVDAMIEKLSLGQCADTLLGIPGLIKGVSGGEKKRTNIGAELINNPIILLLDEPTTGLDSVNALRVGQLLRDLAHQEGRTVICTIHTPSSELYDVFDDVLLLAKGSVVYHGPRNEAPEYFGKLGYAVPQRINPSEHFMKLLQLPPEEQDHLIKAWEQHSKSLEAASNRCLNRTPFPSQVEPSDEQFDRILAARHITLWAEMMLLTQRSWRTTIRDPAGTFGRLIQCLFFAVLLALFFANLKKDDAGVTDRAGVLFMAVVNTVFMHVLSAIAIFPPERAVFLQEQSNGMYNACMYYVSKCIAEFPIVSALPVVYQIITYWSWDLANSPAAWFNDFVTLQLLAHTGNAFGLFLASLFPRPEIAMTVAPLAIMPQLLVGGLFANTARLEPAWYWLEYISFPRYGYKALFTTEFDHIGQLCASGNDCRFQTPQDVLAYYGFDKATDKVWFDVIPLLLFLILYRCVGALGLYIQGSMRRNELVFEGNYKHLGKPAKGTSSILMRSRSSSSAGKNDSQVSKVTTASVEPPVEGPAIDPQTDEPHYVVDSNHEPVTPAPPAELAMMRAAMLNSAEIPAEDVVMTHEPVTPAVHDHRIASLLSVST